MSYRRIALPAATFAFALFATTALADGTVVRSDISQVRYMLEKYALNDPANYCLRSATLADANPGRREEINGESKNIGQRHGLGDCSGAAVVAPANPPPAAIYQPAPPPPMQPQPMPYGYGTQQPIYGTQYPQQAA